MDGRARAGRSVGTRDDGVGGMLAQAEEGVVPLGGAIARHPHEEWPLTQVSPEFADLSSRMLIMSAAPRKASRPRTEHEIQRVASGWGRAAVARAVEGFEGDCRGT